VHQLAQRLLAAAHRREHHGADFAIGLGQGRLGDLEEDVLLARDPLEGVDQLVGHLLLGAGTDPVDRGDQQVDQRVGHLPLALHQQGRQQGEPRLRAAAAQMRRGFHRSLLPPTGQYLRCHIGEQARRQPDRPDRGQLADLAQHRLQAHVPRHRLHQRQHRLPVGILRCLLLVRLRRAVPLGVDQGKDPVADLRCHPGGDRGEPCLLRRVQRRAHHPGDPVRRGRLDELLAAVLEQFHPDPVSVALRAGHVDRQPGGQLVRVLHRAHPKAQVIAYLGAVVLDRPPGPLVQPEVRRGHLHLPGDEINDLVREVGPSPGELPNSRVVLEQEGGAQARRTPFARHQLPLVIEHRPVLDLLVHAHRLPTHAPGSCRAWARQGGETVKHPRRLRLVTRSLTAPELGRPPR
jgi:hypothetical protein